MKELYSKEINEKIKEVKVEDESAVFVLESGTELKFESHHENDCCEHVYADFSVLKYHASELINPDFNAEKLVIKGIEKMGFLLIIESHKPVKVFIPCYNYQNGYYSDNLELQISQREVKTTVSLHGFIEDHC